MYASCIAAEKRSASGERKTPEITVGGNNRFLGDKEEDEIVDVLFVAWGAKLRKMIPIYASASSDECDSWRAVTPESKMERCEGH